MVKNYDFAGYATRSNVKCSDGRIINTDAFKHQDGAKVPLVWNHNHKDADNVVGHAILENRKEGVYAYGFFNETPQGLNAKELVKHGDISALSIFANKLKQKANSVIHGIIREVSLVLAGANPGAYIETVLSHSEDATEEAMIFNASEDLVLAHSDDPEADPELDPEADPEADPESDQEKDPEDLENKEKEIKHKMPEKTVKDVFDELTEEQKNVVYALIGQALEEQNKDEVEGEDKKMKHNLFDGDQDLTNEENVLAHSELLEIFKDAKTVGSMREAFLQHGITDVDTLFPEAQTVTRTPEMISRDMEWVSAIMAKVKKTPFSRVKSTAANVTADEARARGYVTGAQKVEEVITALKRTTSPTTVYKFQKMNRDDVIDITDFDVVAWLKAEMRVMLDEEIARAILIGDGRLPSDESKIDPLNIRPILGDDPLYTVARIVEGESAPGVELSEEDFAKNLIKDIVRARKLYKGSGNPTYFTTEDVLTEMLLIKDSTGRDIYDNVAQLATKLRVSSIVTVPVMENQVRNAGGFDYTVVGILVNMADYNVGADKGGKVSFFEDFDLNYNKQEYLIEGRCSGALVKPYSAISFEKKTTEAVG